jgi:phosphohistidine phosphatase
MKLILTRHAKSAWDDPLLDDHDRPLNARGERSARLIGQWLAANGHIPGAVIHSSALRTAATWAGAAAALPPADVRAEPKLYHASSDRMLSVLYTAEADTVMMIGHNPGIAEFASRILRSPVSHERFWDYPTGATLVATLEIARWGEARFGAAIPVDFVIPRDLEG